MTEQLIIPAKVYREVPMPRKGGRRLVIPDIHGCARTFTALLEQMAPTTEDQIFILGDMINRGPDSHQVLDIILALQDQGLNVMALRGNHEEMLLAAIEAGPERLAEFMTGQPKLQVLLNKKGKVRKRYRRLLATLPLYYLTDGFLLIHAGLNLSIPDPFTDLHAMTWIRDFKAREPINGRKVIHGHQPRPYPNILKSIENKAYSIGIDNGCVLVPNGREVGALLCLDLDSFKVFSQRSLEN